MSKVGIIVGSGTGRELADVFARGVVRLAGAAGRRVEVVECEHEFKSYHHLLGSTPDRIEEAVREDLARLEDFYTDFYRAGGRAVFRTAINAETLYRFRQVGRAVKTVYIPRRQKRLLLVRDQLQGFYANDSCRFGADEVSFAGSFSRSNFQLLARRSLAEADRVLRQPYDIWVVYKHHLFATLIETWTHDLFEQAGVYQPNHATDLLFRYLQEGDDGGGRDLLMIAGNEVGDILHEVLIFNLKLGTRNNLHSRSVYLRPDLDGLVEYQTVHGSADGIGGQGSVNPLATLRAAGAFVEEQLGRAGFGALVEEAVGRAELAGARGRDEGGHSSTEEITEAVLAQAEHLAGRAAAAPGGGDNT